MKQFILLLYFCLANAQASTLKDPTKPSPSKPVVSTGKGQNILAPLGLKLTAIINNNQNKQAIINGKSFTQGQRVQNYTLILISQNHVTLNGSDGQQMLFVNDNNIRKDINNGF
ncbi:MAG: MSHA biogenesis protein MshK [Flavobacteriales bacterium]|jgi:MSHA biogenesis protein MshK